jgi:hypothetical protein
MSLHKSDSKSSIASSNKKEQIPSNETMAEFSTTHVHSTPQMMEIHEYQTEEKKTIDPSDTSVHIPTSFEVKHDNIASEDEEDEDEDEPGWFSRIYSRYRKWFQ